jgi:hypothetical protein
MNEVIDQERVQTEEPQSQNDVSARLLPDNIIQDLRSKWDRIQTGFVDEPKSAVKEADQLVSYAIKQLEDSLSGACETLVHQWDRGDNVNTEDLRIALRKYRAFFERLLAI